MMKFLKLAVLTLLLCAASLWAEEKRHGPVGYRGESKPGQRR